MAHLPPSSALSPPPTALYTSPISLTSPGIPDVPAGPSSLAQAMSRPSSRQPSFALGPISESLRRPSSFTRISSRMSSRGSSSGVSTPLGRKRRQGAGLAGPSAISNAAAAEKGDWAHMDADEVFRRLPVGEVKKVEDKLRKEATSKQGELRSMVGTRYRDLLTSTSQITALREKSIKLSGNLKEVVQACSDTVHLGASAPEKGDDGQDVEDVMNLLPVAAHMKLLLDAPEALYAHLSQQAHLKAAFLWLMARVVREGLLNMSDALSETYGPLVEKQWETLHPLRQQIAHRATVFLRRTENTDPRVLSETLLAIMLLDSLSLEDVLELFLAQRLRAIRELLVHPDETTGNRKPPIARKGRRRASSAARGLYTRQAVQTALGNAVRALLDSVSLARKIFATKQGMLVSDSLMQEMVKLVQEGEATIVNPSPAPKQQTSHQQRRASRLVSISMAMPAANLAADAKIPPVSARQIISSLPSSQILLRHLPVSVTGFTPFISPTSTPDLAARLQAWGKTATAALDEALPAWLRGLMSVTDIWAVRASLRDQLQANEFGETILRALEGAWTERTKAVWNDKLEALLETAESKITAAVEHLETHSDEPDSRPDTFMFSELAFPSVPTSSLSAPLASSSLSSFIGSLKKRSALRTPQMDGILVALEDAATDLKVDMQGLPSALHEDYSARVSAMLDNLVGLFQRLRESAADKPPGASVDLGLFVGRTALHLAKGSTFLQDITGEAKVQTESTVDALLNVFSSSTGPWSKRSLGKAVALLQPTFGADGSAEEVKASWQGPIPVGPSTVIMSSLNSLVIARRDLGIPPNVDLPIVKDLVEAFVQQVNDLQGWKQLEAEAAAQALVDLAFLDVIAGRSVVEAAQAHESLLAKAPEAIRADLASKLLDIVADALRKTQLLLGPLLAHVAVDVLPQSATKTSAVDTRGNLLRFGPPAGARGGAGTEFRSPIAVARPGKRFGLLSIAA